MTDTAAPAPAPAALSASTVLRRHAEQQYAEELDALARADRRPRPENWRLSPQAVVTRTKRQAPGFSPGSSVQAGTACCCSMY